LLAVPSAARPDRSSIVRDGDCVLGHPSGYAPMPSGSSGFEVLTAHATSSVAGRIVGVIEAHGMFASYEGC
jgi:hypothetical protein